MLSSTSCRRPLLELQTPNEHIQIQKEKENIFVACLRPPKEPNLHPRMEKPNRFCATLWCSMNRNSDRSGSEWVGVRTGIHWGGWNGSEWVQLNKPPPPGGYSTNVCKGRLRPEVPPLILLHIIVHEKGTPFVYLLLTNATPFTDFPSLLYTSASEIPTLNMPESWKGNNNKNELYLHDHTSTYSIAKAILRIKITS